MINKTDILTKEQLNEYNNITGGDHALLSPSKAFAWKDCPACALYSYLTIPTENKYTKRGSILHYYIGLILKHCDSLKTLKNNVYKELVNNKTSIRDFLEELITSEDINPYPPYEYLNNSDADLLILTLKSLCEDVLKIDKLYLKNCTDKNYGYYFSGFGVEDRVFFGKALNTSDEYAFGTIDLYFIFEDTLYVLDFKFGRIKVKAKNNLQLALYTKGILNSKSSKLLNKVKNMQLGIIQPVYVDSEPFEKGILTAKEVRSDIFKLSNTKELTDLCNSLKKPAKRILSLYKGTSFLQPSDFKEDCKYCSAKGVNNLILTEKAKKAFLPNSDLSASLKLLPFLKKFIKEVEEQATEVFERGGDIKGFEFVNSIKKPLKWKDNDVSYLLANIPEVKITEDKIRTPTAVLKDLIKILGKNTAEEKIQKLTYRDPSNKVIVPIKHGIYELNF